MVVPRGGQTVDIQIGHQFLPHYPPAIHRSPLQGYLVNNDKEVIRHVLGKLVITQLSINFDHPTHLLMAFPKLCKRQTAK